MWSLAGAVHVRHARRLAAAVGVVQVVGTPGGAAVPADRDAEVVPRLSLNWPPPPQGVPLDVQVPVRSRCARRLLA